MDLEDSSRSLVSAMMICGVYIGSIDPNYHIHDRIIDWINVNFEHQIICRQDTFRGKVITAVFDDPARRKVYNLKMFSSPGSCPYCLSQETILKINDQNVIGMSL
ncbi:unnamed protein product [Caenorhabditis bovis]|uniref:Uncharacterized protein n=1 Tax=Caenorhabditis bovis TaxID=2654633 RepID=A0A8S1ECT8_9PELO|nr:unnamed protein product [Caenorhabditis bovis]CAB3404073.1 unnamed protein product [Caenorhabditis bovis]CAB3407850.1 unnamed protein product [Caenorhabditis bovis]